MVFSLILYATAALVAVGVLLYCVGTYNEMVQSAREIDRSFANLEVSLKQRHDEIPRLVEICRGYMDHERALLERVARSRSGFADATDVTSKVDSENGLNRELKDLYARVEAYPALQADSLFQELSQRLTALEDLISDRRELFNSSVTAFNTLVQSFPALIVARPLGFRPRAPLDLGPEMKKSAPSLAKASNT